MRGNDPLQWENLVVERGAVPLQLDDAAFREWMAVRRVFVSSVMDPEMTASRDAVRTFLRSWGATSVMWEEITPRDQHPENAYLEGVDSSSLLVLLVGSRYGIPDGSGYSPTQKEVDRARDRQLPRLLFVMADIADADRAGKLNDWLRELYGQVSAAKYKNPDDLCRQLEHQLREMAARQESLWLKLGPLVFPGRISQRRANGAALYTVSARVRDGAVRRALSELGGFGGRVRADRLSWVTETQPVSVQEVSAETGRTSESAVSVTCAQASDRGSNYAALGGMSIGGAGGRSYGPSDQAEIWAKSAVFGVTAQDADRGRGHDMMSMFTSHEGPTLPEVLRTQSAGGWLAEGLTRLFVVEQLIGKYGGHFERLDVGPATATGVRVLASFHPNGGPRPAVLDGVVPLP